MEIEPRIHAINDRIQLIKRHAEDLKSMAADLPAVYRNTARILASLKMLEINISDVIETCDDTTHDGPGPGAPGQPA